MPKFKDSYSDELENNQETMRNLRILFLKKKLLEKLNKNLDLVN